MGEPKVLDGFDDRLEFVYFSSACSGGVGSAARYAVATFVALGGGGEDYN